MCGRVYIKTALEGLFHDFSFARREADAEGLSNQFPRYNGAPTQFYPIIILDVIREPDCLRADLSQRALGPDPAVDQGTEDRPAATDQRQVRRHLDHWHVEGRLSPPALPHPNRRLLRVEGHPLHRPQQAALRHRDEIGEPFALAGIWETWRDPATDEDIRTFCVIICPANDMGATIHNRMPVILHKEDYERWLSPEPDPFELMNPFPADLTMWPIGRNVGSPKNDKADILDPIDPRI